SSTVTIVEWSVSSDWVDILGNSILFGVARTQRARLVAERAEGA
ncbi:MAG: hypothetical protein QOF25_1532, partial [Mycobacterium sp.]|nr:hypothetical protein [Mycobacterium sp.]